MTNGAKEILKTIKMYGSWGVYADAIVECAELIRGGYARAEPDYEGPRMFITDKGERYAKRNFRHPGE